MAAATEVTDVDLTHWVPGSRMFHTDGGVYYIVDADLAEYPTGPNTFIRRQTSIFECDAAGVVSDLTPDFTYPPGTTAEEALAEMGYTVTAG